MKLETLCQKPKGQIYIILVLHQVFFSNSVVKFAVRQVTYIASFNNKLPEVTAPVESHRSAIPEWATPTINLHEGLLARKVANL